MGSRLHTKKGLRKRRGTTQTSSRSSLSINGRLWRNGGPQKTPPGDKDFGRPGLYAVPSPDDGSMLAATSSATSSTFIFSRPVSLIPYLSIVMQSGQATAIVPEASPL